MRAKIFTPFSVSSVSSRWMVAFAGCRDSRRINPFTVSVDLDACIPFIPLVFPVSAIAPFDPLEVGNELDSHDVFRHLVPQLALDTHPDRRAVLDRQRLAVQFIGENRLWVVSIL